MKDQDKTEKQLMNELGKLHQWTTELETTSTGRKRAEKALRESEARYRAVVEDQTELICRFQPDGALTFVNEAYCRYFGKRREELIGRSCMSLIPEEDREFAASQFTSLSAENPTITYEHRVLAAGGEIRWQQWTDRAIFDEQGRTIEYQSVGRDITEQKQAEEDIRQRNQELAALNAITATMMQSALDLDEVLQLTADGVVQGLGCNTGLIFLLDEKEGIFRISAISTKARILNRINAIIGFPLVQIEFPARSDFNEAMSNLLAGRTTVKQDLHELIGPLLSKPVCSAMQELLDSRSFFTMPLLAKGKTIGGIVASTPQELSEEDTAGLMTFANQAAIAIENARLYEEAQQRALEQETLREAALALTTALDRNQVIDRILAQLQQVVPYDSASVQLLREGQMAIVGGRGFPNLPELLGTTFPADGDNPNSEVIRTQAPFIVEDAPTVYEGFRKGPHLQTVIRSWLGVPMLIGERLVGMIALDRQEPGFYTQDHARLAEAFAVQAAVAIENARLFEEEKRRATQLALISEVGEKAASILDLDGLMQEVTRSIQESFNYYNVALVLLDEERGEVVIQAIAGGFEHLVAGGYRQSIDKGIVGFVARTGQSWLANDISKDPHYVKGFLGEVLTKSELCVPIKLDDQVIGALDVQSIRLNAFDQSDLAAMEAVANRIATSIHNARLYEEMAGLYDIGLTVSSALELDKTLRAIYEQVNALMSPDTFYVALYDEEGGELRFEVFVEDSEWLPKFTKNLDEGGLTAWIVQSRKPLFIGDIEEDGEKLPVRPSQRGKAGTRSWMGLPLIARDKVVGVISVQSFRPHAFTEENKRTFSAFANQAAIAIENARLYEEIEERRVYLEGVLREAPDAIVTLDDGFQVVEWNAGAERLFGYSQEEVVGQHLDDLVTNPDVFEEATGFTQRVLGGKELPPTEAVRYRKDGSPVDVIVAGSPILMGDEVIGVVAVYTDISERVRMEETLRTLAFLDELTGLYNRRGFLTLAEQQLKTADRAKRKMLLLFADFDHLKHINDTLGHTQGDLALIEVADVLRDKFRESDIIARIGGDEFVVLATETGEASADAITARLQENLKAINAREGRRYKLSLSMGIAHYDFEQPCSIEALLARADRAMYERKQSDTSG
jgi:diguanylate cyclase (GGDEF)-like protein/PAS domain S-box-containing protein